MKKYHYTLLLSIVTAFCFAQNSYTIKMVSKTEGLPEPYAASADMDFIIYSKGDRYKSETTSMMFNSILYSDGKLVTSLVDFMGNKAGFTATKEELNTPDEEETKPTIEYINEKKMIAGYECLKAIITKIKKDKSENKTIVWYTDKIIINGELARKANKRYNADLGDLKGFPMAMELNGKMQGMDVKTTMTVTEILLTNLEDSLFVPNTDGYTMDTYKAYTDKMKAMQGGR